MIFSCQETGDIEAIDEAIVALQGNRLVLKIVEGLQDNFLCEMRFLTAKKKASLGQPYLIKSFKKKFSDQREKMKSHKIPDRAKFLIVRPMRDSVYISEEDKKLLCWKLECCCSS